MIFSGLLKIEEEAEEGSWYGLSPKCYYLGTQADHKIGTKGVPKKCDMSAEEFKTALYDPECTITRNFNCLQFDKKIGSVCMTNITKKSLNAAYSKMFVSDDLVTCKSWDSVQN